MSTLRVLLADDHALFRDGIASLLIAWDMEVVGQVGNGGEAVQRVGELQPDLVLMDINMLGMSGLEATRKIKSQWPEIKVVMLTASEEEEDLFEAIKSGAQGYLLKNIHSQEFGELLTGLAKGEAALSRSLAAKILAEFARPHEEAPDTDPDDELEQLTPREKEVLEQLADGLSNKEISFALVISENTVKYHVRNILSKLHLSSRTQAAAYAIREGLADTSPD
jgi:DNA-binding NarL/FixJ family response regulator